MMITEEDCMFAVPPFHTWMFLPLPFIAETELGFWSQIIDNVNEYVYTDCSLTEQTEQFSSAGNLILYFIKAKLLFF